MESFGQRVRRRREQLGMSQDELAKKIDVKSGKQTISRWEQDKSEPSLSDVRKLAAALDVTYDWLVDGEESSSNAKQDLPAGYSLVPSDEYIELQRRVIQRQDQEIARQRA